MPVGVTHPTAVGDKGAAAYAAVDARCVPADITHTICIASFQANNGCLAKQECSHTLSTYAVICIFEGGMSSTNLSYLVCSSCSVWHVAKLGANDLGSRPLARLLESNLVSGPVSH